MLWAVGIQARLLYLQVHRHQDLQARAENQSARTMDISAKRGDILDRHGRVLAYSVDADSVYGVPSEIENAGKTAAMLCEALTDCAPKEQDALTARLRQKRAFVYVRRRVTPHQATRIAELDLEGVGFIKEDRRFYPKKQLAAQLLGFVGIDNKGLAGIEAAYDSQISGALGKLLYQTDARGRAFSRLERPPTAGATVELTIDEYLQHIAERELRDAVARNRAAGGTVLIMAPKTGEILALANEPTFNPNAFCERVARASPQSRRAGHLRARIDLQGRDGERGARRARHWRRRHHRRLGRKDPIRIARDRRHARLRDAVVHRRDGEVEQRRRHQGRAAARGRSGWGCTCADLDSAARSRPIFPAETTGIVWDPRKLDNSALASMSMGYQVGVTPLQMVAAVSSVANGGDLMQPRVVRALIRDGKRIEVKPTDPRPDDFERHRRHAHRHHGADRRAWNGDLRAGCGLHDRGQNRNGSEAGQRPLLAIPTTTRRLSGSFRRAIRWRPSSSSSIRRTRAAITAGRLRVRSFSGSRRRRFGTSACRRR